MDVNPTNPTTPATGNASTNQKTKSADSTGSIDEATGGITSDFNTFLKMLTTQMQNQDPTNPMDASDFAVQLATFSGVEQQVKTNQLLSGLKSQLNVMGLSQLSGWIGKSALVDAPVQFSGSPIELEPKFADGAASAKLVVTDSAGKAVQTLDLPIQDEDVAWAGVDADGNALPQGNYSFSVESYSSDGTKLGTDNIPAYAHIAEARNSDDGISLVLDGGSTVSTSDVLALRDDEAAAA